MPRNLLAFLIVVLSACGSPRPVVTMNQLAPGTIVWPSSLDHESTPATHRLAAVLVLEQSGARQAMATIVEISLKQQLEGNSMLAQYADVMREFLARYLSFDALADDFAKLYMDRFTELQLRQIAAFYQTPTGKLAVERLQSLMQEGAKLGVAKVQAHQAELVEMIQRATPVPSGLGVP